MAIITLSGLLSDIRGSMSGTTFQRSAAGLIMRTKPVPVGPGTFAQQRVKNRQAIINNAWLNLTQQQRDNWKSFSNYVNGQGFTNTGRKSANVGKMSFINVNSKLLEYGKSILITPVFTTPPDPVTPCPPLFTESDNLMNYTGSIDITKEILVTKMSLHQSAATTTNNTGFRNLVYTQVSGDQQNWIMAYRDVYGVDYINGKKYWIELQVVNFITGQMSTKTKSLVLFTGLSSAGIGSMVIEGNFIVG